MDYVAKKEQALKSKIIAQTKQADFAEFWASQVETLRKKPLKVTKKKIDNQFAWVSHNGEIELIKIVGENADEK